MVSVHQDPDDATKPRGTDILGSLMLIDSSPGRQHPDRLRLGQPAGRSPQRGHVAHRPEDRDRPVAQPRHRSRAAVRSRCPSSSDLTGDGTEDGGTGRHPLPGRDDVQGGAEDRRVLRQGECLAGRLVGDVPHDASQLRPAGLLHPDRTVRSPRRRGRRPETTSRRSTSSTVTRPRATRQTALRRRSSPSRRRRRDPETGQMIRRQQIEAQELASSSGDRSGGRRPYRHVTAHASGSGPDLGTRLS